MLQWQFAQKELYPTTLVALIDVAPMVGLVPRFTCYCLALAAALQETPHPGRRCGLLHGAKHVKVWCTVFVRTSPWYAELRHRGPWSYDWQPDMPRLRRFLSACFIVTACLEEEEKIPSDDDIEAAVQHGQNISSTKEQWPQLEAELSAAHAQLDEAFTGESIAALAKVLARMTASVSRTA